MKVRGMNFYSCFNITFKQGLGMNTVLVQCNASSSISSLDRNTQKHPRVFKTRKQIRITFYPNKIFQ